MEDAIFWAIKDDKDRFYAYISPIRPVTITQFLHGQGVKITKGNWDMFRKSGIKCVKVRLVEIKKSK